jgi:protoporphyrin/coproporphyrin ferrochelatase
MLLRWRGCSTNLPTSPKAAAGMVRRAVVLMNLGGPDSPDSVRSFLYNLFSDPAIIRLPAGLRLPLAWLIAMRRAHIARAIYAQLGGSSPLLANTEAQARALEGELGAGYRCFIAMRYWHPLTAAAVGAVKTWRPDQIVLLPLYPQFSTTTTGSSLAMWRHEAMRQGLDCETRAIRSYPTAEGLVGALAALVGRALADAAAGPAPVRLLFSAHGLPLRIVRAGDPYPAEIASTATAVVRALGRARLDWVVCYQSRVGPLAWLGPSVEDELRRAGRDGVAVVIAPISFVSEHSETLVELDRDYRSVAEACGVPGYHRAATVGTDPRFIAALAELVHAAVRRETPAEPSAAISARPPGTAS